MARSWRRLTRARGPAPARPGSRSRSENASAPHAQLTQLIAGQRATQAVAVAARLALADRLAGRPRTAAELAEETGAAAHPLDRLLRALADLGLVKVTGGGRFELTAIGHFLRSDAPRSLRATAMMEGSPWMWRSWGRLGHSVHTGEPAVDHALGQRLYEYLRDHPDEERVFDGAMAAVAEGMTHPALLGAYDFSGIGTLVDVGGGRGALLAAVLSAHPEMRGVVFDRPSVAESARAHLETAGVADRCEVAGGDFFESVPAGADGYVISMVLNDWDDDSVHAILSSCRSAIPERGRLLIVEMLDVPSKGRGLLDLQLLVITRGRLRTQPEWTGLLSESGFRLARVIPTRSPQSVLEATPS